MSKEANKTLFSGQRNIIREAEQFAADKMKGYDSGHNWWHIDRVRKLASYINAEECLSHPLTLELAALFHDLGDHKFTDDPTAAEKDIEDFMLKHSLPAEMIEAVIDVNRNISFSKGVKSAEKSGVLMVVQDADRIDAIGAIGIARAFTYGAFKGNEIYNPGAAFAPVAINESEGGTTIGHFYDKLLKLRDLMNTSTGKAIADERHQYLEGFLSQFYREFYCIYPWNNNKPL